MAKFPTGYFVFIYEDDGKVVLSDPQEITLCHECTHRGTDECKWRKDEIPEDMDFCSEGEVTVPVNGPMN